MLMMARHSSMTHSSARFTGKTERDTETGLDYFGVSVVQVVRRFTTQSF